MWETVALQVMSLGLSCVHRWINHYLVLMSQTYPLEPLIADLSPLTRVRFSSRGMVKACSASVTPSSSMTFSSSSWMVADPPRPLSASTVTSIIPGKSGSVSASISNLLLIRSSFNLLSKRLQRPFCLLSNTFGQAIPQRGRTLLPIHLRHH